VSRFKNLVNRLICASIEKISQPVPGMVIDFDHDSMTVVVEGPGPRGTETTSRYELPWITPAPGVWTPDPVIGTYVMLAFNAGHPDKPYIASVYDPFWESSGAAACARSVGSYTTRIDRALPL
jgi:hypothetical protein